MTLAYNTGTATDPGAQQNTTTITVPAGVLAGDIVLVVAVAIPITANINTLSASSTGTTPVQIGTTQTASEPLPATLTAAAYGFTAAGTSGASSDAGKVITVTSSPDTAFWSIGLVAYTPAGGAATVDVNGGTAVGGGGATAVTVPAETTTLAGDWAVYAAVGATEAGNFTAPGGVTTRQDHRSGNAVEVMLTDSNGSVGGAGTSIGNLTFTTPSNANNILAGFTIGLGQAAAGGPSGQVQPRATVPVPRRRPARAGAWSSAAGPGNAAPVPPAPPAVIMPGRSSRFVEVYRLAAG